MENSIPYHADITQPAIRPGRVGLILVFSILGLALVSSLWWGPLLTDRIEAAAARRACLSYTSPTDKIVFEEDPGALDELSSQPGYEKTVGGRLCWVPACWRQETANLRSSGTVFLHQLTSPAGHTRLVSVDVEVGAGMWLSTTGAIQDVSLASTVIAPGSGLASDVPLHLNQTVLWVCPVDARPTRFYGGAVDPGDPSRFTFDYERNGVRSTVDGRLNDDDTVTLTPRTGITTHDREPLRWEPDGKAK